MTVWMKSMITVCKLNAPTVRAGCFYSIVSILRLLWFSNHCIFSEYVRCGTSGQCINAADQCNYIVDCDNGWDEDENTCWTTTQQDLFISDGQCVYVHVIYKNKQCTRTCSLLSSNEIYMYNASFNSSWIWTNASVFLWLYFDSLCTFLTYWYIAFIFCDFIVQASFTLTAQSTGTIEVYSTDGQVLHTFPAGTCPCSNDFTPQGAFAFKIHSTADRYFVMWEEYFPNECNCFLGLQQYLYCSSTSNGVFSSSHWLCSNAEEDGWFKSHFDDSSWANAYVITEHSAYSDGTLNSFDDQAQLVWHHELESDIIYCRVRLFHGYTIFCHTLSYMYMYYSVILLFVFYWF